MMFSLLSLECLLVHNPQTVSASVYQLSAAAGILLDILRVQGELHPEAVIPAEVPKPPADQRTCDQIFLVKQTEDAKHHLIGELLPGVVIRPCPLAARTAVPAPLYLDGLLLLLLSTVLFLLLMLELLADEEDVHAGVAAAAPALLRLVRFLLLLLAGMLLIFVLLGLLAGEEDICPEVDIRACPLAAQNAVPAPL